MKQEKIHRYVSKILAMNYLGTKSHSSFAFFILAEILGLDPGGGDG